MEPFSNLTDIGDLRRTLEVQPDGFGYERLSDLYIMAGDPERGLKAARTSLEFEPRNFAAYLNEATCLSKLEFPDKALKACDAASSLVPGDPRPRLERSMIYVADDRFKEAHETLLDLIKRHPDHKLANQLLRHVKHELEDRKKWGVEPASRKIELHQLAY